MNFTKNNEANETMNEKLKKNCLICSQEYEVQPSPKGQEQKYCSATCRNKAAYQRRESHILAKFSGQLHNESTHRDDNRQLEGVHIRTTDIGTAKVIEMITDNAELRAENRRLTDKVQELQMENAELINELDAIPQQDNMGSIGKLVTDYAPVLISLFTQHRNNAQQTTPTS